MTDHDLLIRQINNYQDTLIGLLAFLNECGWLPNEKKMEEDFQFGVGRRMDTSSANTISPNNIITPDLVVQKQKHFRVVGEVKHSWAAVGDWDENLRQMVKYDDDLVGWWSSSERAPDGHDLALLVHSSQAVKVSDFIDEKLKKKELSFGRNLAVVGYQRIEQVQQFIQLRREHGNFRDKTFDKRLREVVSVGVDKIVWRDKRFYDYPPPMAYLLQMLWDDVFDSLADNSPKVLGRPYVETAVTVENLTSQLQLFYGFTGDGKRNPGIPKSQWTREALELLIRMKLAHKDEDKDRYVIHYRRLRGDKLERFGKLIRKLAKKKGKRGRIRLASGSRRRSVPDTQGRLFEQ